MVLGETSRSSFEIVTVARDALLKLRDLTGHAVSLCALLDDDLVVLERGVLPLLHSLAEPFFVVLHMDGSHLPYRDHSPPSHKVFLPEDGVNSMNAYDNTLRVTGESPAWV